jgi:hypothetical protein
MLVQDLPVETQNYYDERLLDYPLLTIKRMLLVDNSLVPMIHTNSTLKQYEKV